MSPERQHSLFIDPATDPARRAPLWVAFEHWVALRASARATALRESSLRVYMSMWSVVVDSLPAGVPPDRINEHALHAMLGRIGHTAIYRKRVLALVGHVLASGLPSGHPNPARTLLQQPEVRAADARSQAPPPTYLNERQQQALVEALTTRVRQGAWQRQRDVAMAAVILGGGVKPGKCRELRMDQIVRAELDAVNGRTPRSLTLEDDGNSARHEVKLAHWAQQVLADWLAARAALRIGGDYVFPATLVGDRTIARQTLFRQIEKLKAELRIVTRKQGTHVLRHTFAVRQLSHGSSQTKVQKELGLKLPESMLPYSRIVPPGEVH